MSKKVLWVTQLSSVVKGTNKFTIMSDSNYNFAKPILKNLYEQMQLFVTLPTNSVDYDEAIIDLVKGTNNIYAVPQKVPANAMATRFHFDYFFWNDKLDVIRPDVIVCNDPVHVKPMKAVCMNIGINPKIITYFHWLDTPNDPRTEIGYWARQKEGAETADLVLFNSQWALKEFASAASISWRSKKLSVLPPPVEEMEVKTHVGNHIMYSHRLSSDPYYDRAFQMFIRLLDGITYSGKKSTIIFTDPSRKIKDVDELRKLVPDNFNVELAHYTRDEYMNALMSKDVGIVINTFLESKGMWSMSTMDAGACGNAVILPKRFGYAEMAHPEYKGFYKTEFYAKRLLQQAIESNEFRELLALDFAEYAQQFNATNTALRFEAMLWKL